MTRFLISAPSSGAGKTTITLGLLRVFSRLGLDINPAKSGPDYIDPKFHEVACGRQSMNLDAWAMSEAQIKSQGGSAGLIVEGAMGLFDGAGLPGRGSSADVAKILGLPVVLVVDAAKTAHSVAALVHGFRSFDKDINIAGVILNRVGSDRHRDMLTSALNRQGIAVFGCIGRNALMALPERHLGLVQASELDGLDHWIDELANQIEQNVDLNALQELDSTASTTLPTMPLPPAQSIAIARDVAFEFCYPHLLRSWQHAGAEISFFSPLENQMVPTNCNFVFLPGGYPELHAGRLAAADKFLGSLRVHAKTKPIYGECGGYMTLGDGMVDADGQRHQMAGLLRLETSFAKRKLHLGYRSLVPKTDQFSGPLKAHEFHYASTISADGPSLFSARDADDKPLGDMGLHLGHVYGSFAHIISGI